MSGDELPQDSGSAFGHLRRGTSSVAITGSQMAYRAYLNQRLDCSCWGAEMCGECELKWRAYQDARGRTTDDT